jgi:hypothetical protein
VRAATYGHFLVVQWLVEVVGVELDIQNDVSHSLIFSFVIVIVIVIVFDY